MRGDVALCVYNVCYGCDVCLTSLSLFPSPLPRASPSLALRRYTLPLVAGRGEGLGVVPYRRPLLTVIGKPVPVPHIPEPSLEEVLEVRVSLNLPLPSAPLSLSLSYSPSLSLSLSLSARPPRCTTATSLRFETCTTSSGTWPMSPAT